MNFRYTFQHAGAHSENFDTSSNYSMDNEKEEENCFSVDSVFNGSSISTITKPDNISKTIVDNGTTGQLNEIRFFLQELNSQFKFLNEKQCKIENQISTSMSKNTLNVCGNLEPFLTGISIFNLMQIENTCQQA